MKETNKKRLRVGYYVICEVSTVVEPTFISNFINNTIGVFKERNDDDETVDFEYSIEYENAPKQFIESEYGNILFCERSDIKHFSKNKEDLEMILNTKKFNI